MGLMERFFGDRDKSGKRGEQLIANPALENLENLRSLQVLFPGPIGAAVAAKPGYPTVIVPFATVPNLLAPPGFDAKPTPFGVSFTGGACSEPRLIELAYAFEQATKRRRAPSLE